jgi:hypothetical protein
LLYEALQNREQRALGRRLDHIENPLHREFCASWFAGLLLVNKRRQLLDRVSFFRKLVD